MIRNITVLGCVKQSLREGIGVFSPFLFFFGGGGGVDRLIAALN